MRTNELKKRNLFALFVAIEIVMTMTSMGYIMIGPIRATLLHIPVIVGAMVLGKRYGAGLGLVFGLSSLFMNTFVPTVTSFVFSPFISVAGQSGSLASLWIVLGPRILLGYLSGWLYGKRPTLNFAIIISASMTLLHTILVLGSIYLFYGEPYAQVKGISLAQLYQALMLIVTTNGIMEMIVSTFVVAAVMKLKTKIFKF